MTTYLDRCQCELWQSELGRNHVKRHCLRAFLGYWSNRCREEGGALTVETVATGQTLDRRKARTDVDRGSLCKECPKWRLIPVRGMRESYDALAVKESKGGGIARSQLIGLQWRKVCRRDPVQFLVANQPGFPSIGGLVISCFLGVSAKFLRGIASNCWLLRKMGRFFAFVPFDSFSSRRWVRPSVGAQR